MTHLFLDDHNSFSEILFEKMKQINLGITELELYEFRYGMNDLVPENGWGSIKLDDKKEIEMRLNNRDFYDGIQIKPKVGDRIVLDDQVVHLAQMLFVGLVTGKYDQDWIIANFYFDIRGFYFLHRTHYFTDKVLAHFDGKPFKRFEQKQKNFEHQQDLGYKDFEEANADIDTLFIESVKKIIAFRGTPILLAIAGPTAAGKTEIVERLRVAFGQAGQHVASIELDNFFTDRDYREAMGIHSQGKQAVHFELFKQSLVDITHGKKISIPYYDTVYATSSHDLDGNLKPGAVPIEIEPADIIFIEGNFPFLLEEVVHLIGIKVVYLTDDPVRLKRKWKRDIDYRKKYDPSYLRNRFFKDQFIMAEIAYLPQMEVCDLTVDTTGAALWVTPEIGEILGKS
jgi:uridine kinase